jgi:phosphate transport system substrate-binding protein
MKKILFLTVSAIAMFASSANAQDAATRDQIRAVGSSTVYPFATVVAEEFGTKTKFRTPIVESTGTGGGFKLFCSGDDVNTPDVVNASRQIKDSEIELCKKNKVENIIEVKVGFDGIILANASKSPKLNIKKEHLFLALAKQVPQGGKLVPNPYKKWSDIDKSLPAQAIEVYGPPPTSGTRDAFVEIVMDKVCEALPEFKTAYADEKVRQKQCQILREDGPFIESGENDNLIVQKLTNNPNSFGIFGYSFLEQNASTIQGSSISSVEPSFENIASGKYLVSRSLYMYIKADHIGKVPGIKEFVTELTSEDAFGDNGYLVMKGLIPLPEAERKKVRDDALAKAGK